MHRKGNLYTVKNGEHFQFRVGEKCVDGFRVVDDNVFDMTPQETIEILFSLGDEVNEVYKHLDKDILNVLVNHPNFTWDTYEFYSADGQEGTVRKQNLMSFPLFATLIPERRSLRRSITSQIAAMNKQGEATSMLDALQTSLPQKTDENGNVVPVFPKNLIKKITGVNVKTENLTNMLYLLAAVPLDWCPKTPQEWKDFSDIADALYYIQYKDVPRDKTAESLLTPQILLAGVKGNWADAKLRFAKAYTDKRPPEGTTKEEYEYYKSVLDGKLMAKMSKSELEVYLKEKELPHLVEWMTRMYHPDISRDAILNAAEEVSAMADNFTKKVLRPTIYNASDMNDGFLHPEIDAYIQMSAYKILFGGQNLVNIFETARHFTSQASNVLGVGIDKADMDAIKEEYEAPKQYEFRPEWPMVFKPVRAPNGVWIVPLTSEPELFFEGESLAHCVGGYKTNCVQNGHSILSFRKYYEDCTVEEANLPLGRNPEYLRAIEAGLARVRGQDFIPNARWRSLSTMQISAIKGNAFDVKQHKGHGNGRVPESCKTAFAWFKRELAANQIEIDHKGISDYYRKFSNVDEVQKDCWYKWANDEKVNLNIEAWSSYVPAKFRVKDLNELYWHPELPEFQEFAKRINPGFIPRRP